MRPTRLPEAPVYVPGGPFVFGEGRAMRTVDLPDFAIATYPVTFGAFAEFLSAVDRECGAEAALDRLPRAPASGDDPYVVRGVDGTYAPRADLLRGPPARRAWDERGPGWPLTLAVVAVSFDDAVAYCAWKARTTGREWRLPTEHEREKAARGVDGRTFPWGDLADSTLCKCRDARPEDSQPEPVGAFRTAESVYGMGDAAGGVWDRTSSWFDPRRTSHVARGGSWDCAPDYLRAASRHACRPEGRHTSLGFRCARSLPVR